MHPLRCPYPGNALALWASRGLDNKLNGVFSVFLQLDQDAFLHFNQNLEHIPLNLQEIMGGKLNFL